MHQLENVKILLIVHFLAVVHFAAINYVWCTNCASHPSQENRETFCLGFGGMSATNTKLFRFANFQSINCVHLESTKAAAHSSDKNIITSDNLAFNLKAPRWFNVGL